MGKIIYEFYYAVGDSVIRTCYDCVVDKETDKMLYGDVFYESGVPYGKRFAINKESLNRIHVIIDQRNGLVYRVQVEGDNRKDARKKARKIIYDHMMNFIEEFKKDKED